MKYINIWNICINQGTNIFQMINSCYKNRTWIKDPIKVSNRPIDFNVAEY